ncbi:hypothetical protein OHA70_02930 [Kribbella sp. NBC_00382]|uniref:hypothetical protein n=1 Tax=Kribbella sp. NBC_00382 TaxID=2975967 RepID=UPI002E20AE33
MKNIRFVVLAAAAGLVLAGCGDESGAGGTPSASTNPSTPIASLPSPSTAPSGLPLTVSRTGGFAGFNDQVAVGTDGIVTASSMGKGPSKCELEPGFLTTLTDAVKQVDWASVGVTKPTVRHPDDMIIAVAAGGGLARLDDPKLKPLVAPVGTLLTEATKPGSLCKPV